MFLDWINCLLEYTTFLELFCMFDPHSVKRTNIIYFAGLSCLTSIFFVLFPYHLLILNMGIFCIVLFLSLCKRPTFNSLLFSFVSFLGIIIFQFTIFSFLPVSLLQTHLGNLFGNIVMVSASGLLLFFIYRSKLSSLLFAFVLRFRVILLLVLVAFLLLGQFYVSRLTEIWSYLPGIIALFVLFLLVASIIVYIRYQQSADRLQAVIFKQSMQNSQNLITTMRMQLHDYKYHLHHLQSLISSASDLSELQKESDSYIDQLDADRSLYEMLLSMNNAVIRAFLFGCCNECQTRNVPIYINTTNVLPDFPLKDYQFIEVAENLFTNALEHNLSLDPDRRYIRITLSSEDGVQLFSIENPADKIDLPLEELYLMNVSTKSGAHQGLGLSSIQSILRANHIHFSGTRNYDAGSIVFSFTYTGEATP